MLTLEAPEEVRENVRKELYFLEEISDVEIREKVVSAWAYSLAREGLSKISDIPGSGSPGSRILKKGTQLDHILGVARLSTRYADELKLLFPELPLDRDVLIAGALIHDVGKPLEYSPSRHKQWSEHPHVSGWPATRHPVHGWHVCLVAGLPEPIAHIAAAHSKEGDFVVRSLEAMIVHYCDHCYWHAIGVGEQTVEGAPKWNPRAEKQAK